MPDLTVSFPRQRLPDPTVVHRPRWGLLIALVACAVLAGCSRDRLAPVAPTPPLAEGSAAELSPNESEGSGHESGVADHDSPIPDARFDGVLPELSSTSDASELVLLQPGSTHTLLVRVEPARSSSTVTTWMLPNGTANAPIPATDRVTMHHRRSAAVGPRAIETAGGGALLVRATDSITTEGGGASFITQRIGADGNINELANPLLVPDWTMRSAWAATRLGDDVLFCFLGAPGIAATAEPNNQIACGTVSPDGQVWTRLPAPIVQPEGGASIEWPTLAGGESHALLTYFDPASRRIEGRFLQYVDGELSASRPSDLTGQDASDGPLAYRRPPMTRAVNEGALFALPAHNDVPARAGLLLLDGSVRGGLSTVTGLGSVFEMPRFVEGDNGHGLVFDATGRRGERSLLAFAEEGAMLIDVVGLFGTAGEPRSRARLGPANGRTMSFVWQVDENPPRVTVIDNYRW